VVAGDAVFQVFHLDVVKVDLGCCICCNDNICMLQVYISSVISDVSNVCFKDVYLDVAYVAMTLPACFKCFICFILML
jgi:hypothetical protein